MKNKKGHKKLLIISIMLTLLLGSSAFVGYRFTQSRSNSAKAASIPALIATPTGVGAEAVVNACKKRIDSIYGPLWEIKIVPKTTSNVKNNTKIWDYSMQVVRINGPSPTGSTVPRQVIHSYLKQLTGASKTGEVKTIFASLILNDQLEIKIKSRPLTESGNSTWGTPITLVVPKDQYSKILNCPLEY